MLSFPEIPCHPLFLKQRNGIGIEAAVRTAKIIIFPRKGNAFQGIDEFFIGYFLPAPAQQPTFEFIHSGFHPLEALHRGGYPGGEPVVHPFITDFAPVVKDVNDQNVNGIQEKTGAGAGKIPQVEKRFAELFAHGQ